MERDLKVPSTSKRQKKIEILDPISKLPDEILIDILSRLSMKEAARTSIISHRWENLWKFYGGCLDFDDNMETRLLLHMLKKQFDDEQRKYIDWVNRVVFSYQGATIEQFRVSFVLGKDQTSTIDKWIEFAAVRKVRRLELDLSSMLALNNVWKPYKGLEEIYSFPTRLLKLGKFSTLTSLRLESVDVTEEDVLKFLSDCQLLEELSIVGAPSLCNLRVVGGGGAGPGLKLKLLEIRDCMLENLRVSGARNLVSFKYRGRDKLELRTLDWNERINIDRKKMLFQDVPQLSSVYFGRGNYCEYLVHTRFKMLPFPISQLQILTLELFDMGSSQLYMFPAPRDEFQKFAKMPNLRQLELAFKVLHEQQSMLFVANSFLRASPRLHKLVLKYGIDRRAARAGNWGRYLWNMVADNGESHRKMVDGCKYECLKEVEFLGWIGRQCDVEFVKHLNEAAGSLERITVDPRHQHVGLGELWKRKPVSLDVISAQEEARNRARDLEQTLCPSTKFVVL